MRLYHQPGLSNRVVSALRHRLERVLLGMSAHGDDRAHGNGAHGEGANESRGRSRSRGRVETEAPEGPSRSADPGSGESVPPTGVIPLLDPLPDEAEKSVLMVSNALAKNIGECASKIITLTEDLGLAVDNVGDARTELSKGFNELREQLTAQLHGITAVTGAVSHQSAEIVKLLKAFDRFSHAAKWAMSGNETIENNVKAVREEIKTQGGKLELCLQSGFEEVSRHLKELVRVMGTPERIHMDTPGTPRRMEMGEPFPPNPPISPPGMVESTAADATPGAELPGGAPPFVGPVPAGANLLPPPTLPTSLFMAYCPDQPGGQRPSGPLGIATPCQRTGIVTKDPGSGALRTLSPTPYRGDQISAISNLWAPNGLGMLRDGKQQFRRIY